MASPSRVKNAEVKEPRQELLWVHDRRLSRQRRGSSQLKNIQLPTANFQVVLSPGFSVVGAKRHLEIGSWKLAIEYSVFKRGRGKGNLIS